MATREEELQRMKGSSLYSYTPFSQARGAENLRGFASGMTPKLSEPQSIFSGSAQQSSQDFSRLQVPPTPNIPLGNTVPVFPDNYNRVMGERMRAPSSIVSGIREGNFSGFSPYSPTLPSMGGLTQTPSMAPATDAITSFGNPMASRTVGITTPYGTASTTLNPEQQAFRFQASQQAEQTGTMPRTPEQQQALLAQMRTRGSAIGRDIAGFQENFFQAKREERDVVNDMVSQAMRSGYTSKEAKAMAQPYYKAQPSSIADIQRDAANYRAIGFDKMSGYMQDNVRGMFPSNMDAKPAFGSGAFVPPARGGVVGGGVVGGGVAASGRIGAPDFGTRAGMDTPSPYPSGDQSRANRAKRRAQRQGIGYGTSDYDPIIPPELRG